MPPTHGKELYLRVLVTGYGPFRGLPTNPSWTAAKRLHNTIIYPSSNDVSPALLPIHITSLEVPVVYDTVLALVPDLHSRPPVLPVYAEPDSLPPPDRGYDFILHVGLAGSHVLRLEAQAHKFGYAVADTAGKAAPIVKTGVLPPCIIRGFGNGYEQFDDVLKAVIIVEKIVEELKQEGTRIYTSYDPGRYLCDFIYYGSMAESQRAAGENGSPTPVLFLHVSPVHDPCCTEEVIEGIIAIIRKVVWSSTATTTSI